MTAPTSVHKARVKIAGAVYEARCGHTVDEPWATDDWTRVSCTKCLRAGAKHSTVVAKLLEEVRDEKRNQKLGGSGGFGSHRGSWGGCG